MKLNTSTQKTPTLPLQSSLSSSTMAAAASWKLPRQAPQSSSSSSLSQDSDSSQLAFDLGTPRFSGIIRSNHEKDSSSRQLEGSFVPYLPQDDAVAAGLGAHEGAIDAVETQEVADLLNEELRKLLKMKQCEFWRAVTMDNSIQASLGSYLQFRRRWYDSPVNEGGTSLAGIVVGEQELFRHVFMVLYRMSSNLEAGSLSSCLSLEEHAEIIQKKQLFDIPKMLDICAIYGHDNPDLTRQLVSNVFFAQKRYNDDLAGVVPILLRTVHTMYQRCCSILMMQLQPSTSESQNSVALRIQQELLELLDYLNDAIVALYSFNDAYPQGAIILVSVGNQSHLEEQILPSLSAIHDALLPTLHKSFFHLGGSAFSTYIESAAELRLKRIRMRLMDLAWQLLCLSYLSKRNAVDHHRGTVSLSQRTFMGDPGARGRAIVQVVSDMAADPSEGFGYQRSEELISTGAFLRNIERKHRLLDTVDQLLQKGLIALDSVQYEQIAALVCYKSPFLTQTPNFSDLSLMEQQGAQGQEADIIHESKVSHIKDILPDYGDGFIAACLEAYDYNPEEVLQRILEGTLHPSLQSLDKNLQSKPNGIGATVCMKDKGKGKINEAPPLALHGNGSFSGTVEGGTKDESSLVQRLASSTLASSSSSGESARMQPSSSVVKGMKGRFVRKESGQGNAALILDERDAVDALRNAAYAAQYEDEYDDSFDDLGTNITDGVEETESLVDLVASKSSRGALANFEETKKISDRVKGDGLTKSTWKGGAWRGEEAHVPRNSNVQSLPFASETGSKPFDTNKRQPMNPTRGRGRGRREEPRGQYFVKDGKNYSYKVAGSVAVSSVEEAEALRITEEETIYGLGRGGNLPIKAEDATDSRNFTAARPGQGSTQMEFSERRGARSHAKGGPRKEHDNHHRKDRAMKKHFSSIGGM